MAQYHIRAEKLKPLVDQADFTKDQLTLILKMMRGCSQLRQGSVIESFFECMINTEKFDIVDGHKVTGQYGTFTPKVVLNKGETLPPQEEAKTDEKLNKALETGIIE